MDNRQSLSYTQNATKETTYIHNEKVGVSISGASYRDSSFDNRNREIPIVPPNIPMQQAVAAKRKSRKIGITIFIIVCVIVFALGIFVALYVKSDKFTSKEVDPLDIYFTRGNVSYSTNLLIPQIDKDSFNAAINKNSSLDDFEGAKIHFKNNPALIGYEAIVENEEIARVVGGKIYGLKPGQTTVTFFTQDGQTVATRVIDVSGIE